MAELRAAPSAENSARGEYPSSHSRRKVAEAAIAVAGVILAVCLVVATLGSGQLGWATGVECQRGSELGQAAYWTPFVLANVPYGGTTFLNSTYWFYSPGFYGQPAVTRVNGMYDIDRGDIAEGDFVSQNWTFYSARNVSIGIGGARVPCVSSITATSNYTRPVTGSNAGWVIQGPGNTTNSNETNTVQGLAPLGGLAFFGNAFVSANEPSISTCGTGSKEMNFSSMSFETRLTSPTGAPAFNLTIPIESFENYTYYFPPDGGTWAIDDLQSNTVGLRGPGLAFSWSPC
jgi:hypothetical protein